MADVNTGGQTVGNDGGGADASNAEPDNDLRDGIDPGDPLTKNGRIKRKRTRDSDDPEDPQSYRYKAYHIRRAFCLFGHIPRIINDGIKRRARATAGELDLTSIQSNRDFDTFTLIMDHLSPAIEEDIVRLRNKAKDFRKLINKIKEAADQARNNDNSCLKRDISCLLTADGTSVLQAIRKGVNSTSKADRGFYNDIMGRYLCPIKFDWDDPTVRKGLRDGEHAVLASIWPRLLYADCYCDPDDLELGLGRNMALVRVVKYLMTGRSSAFSESAGGKTTRAGNAALAGMTEISPRLVAYGACLLRFALSTQESWCQYDNEFNMEEFYWNIVEIFNDADEFGQQLTAWWNFQVFGTSLGASQASTPAEESSISILRTQRAAKRARIFYDTTNISSVAVRGPGNQFSNETSQGGSHGMLPPIAHLTPPSIFSRPAGHCSNTTYGSPGPRLAPISVSVGRPLSSMANPVPLTGYLHPHAIPFSDCAVVTTGGHSGIQDSSRVSSQLSGTHVSANIVRPRSSLDALNAAINLRHP